MPRYRFSAEDCRRGGQASGKLTATSKQKEIAAQTIAQTRPWEKSTGPSTLTGKHTSAQNRSRNRLMKLWSIGPLYISVDDAEELGEAIASVILKINAELDKWKIERRCQIRSRGNDSEFRCLLRIPAAGFTEGLAAQLEAGLSSITLPQNSIEAELGMKPGLLEKSCSLFSAQELFEA